MRWGMGGKTGLGGTKKKRFFRGVLVVGSHQGFGDVTSFVVVSTRECTSHRCFSFHKVFYQTKGCLFILELWSSKKKYGGRKRTDGFEQIRTAPGEGPVEGGYDEDARTAGWRFKYTEVPVRGREKRKIG